MSIKWPPPRCDTCNEELEHDGTCEFCKLRTELAEAHKEIYRVTAEDAKEIEALRLDLAQAEGEALAGDHNMKDLAGTLIMMRDDLLNKLAAIQMKVENAEWCDEDSDGERCCPCCGGKDPRTSRESILTSDEVGHEHDCVLRAALHGKEGE